MGNTSTVLQLQQEDIEEIGQQTGFTQPQIERLHHRFTCLDKNNQGYLTREDFLRLVESKVLLQDSTTGCHECNVLINDRIQDPWF